MMIVRVFFYVGVRNKYKGHYSSIVISIDCPMYIISLACIKINEKRLSSIVSF